MEKLVFVCKKCGWEKSVASQWADLSPRYCGNHKCNYSGRVRKNKSSFLKEPQMLDIIKPELKKLQEHIPVTKDVSKVEPDNTKIVEKREKRKKVRGI